MTRTTFMTPETMNGDQRAIYDAIVASRGTWLNGPFAPMLLQPALAEPTQRLGEFVRYNTSLAPRLTELAILVVARHHDCEFEWYQHKRIALTVGVSTDAAEAIRQDAAPAGLDDEQQAVWRFTHDLLARNRVSDDAYDQVKALFGEVGAVELVGLIGYYSLIAMTLNAHEVPLPAGVTPELPSRQLREIAA